MQWIIVTFWPLFCSLWCATSAARLADVHWNSSNPIFRIDNTDHIIDVNRGNIPYEYDQVNIICPVVTPGTRAEDVEQYIIYNVSKEEYNSCRITNPKPRIIALCDKPEQLMYFTITFRSFTPQPGGLEFHPGQDYYFISTSNGKYSGLRQKQGGKCATHNMRIIFKVCCQEKTTTSTPKDFSPPVSTPLASRLFPASTSLAATSSTTPAPSTFIPRRPTRPYHYFTRRPYYNKTYDIVPHFDEDRHSKYYPSKKPDPDRLPNETRAKNEELVNKLNQANRHLSSSWWFHLLLLLLLAIS